MDSISGVVERITYYNEENGYTVLRLRPERSAGISGLNREGLLTVIGNLPELSPGEHLRIEGRYETHPKHGLQFKAEVCEQVMPATVKGIERYLGSGLIKGIGPGLARRIVKVFRAKTLEIIEKAPERLMEVDGIGPDRSEKITRAWAEQQQIKQIMLFLHGHEVSTNLAVKIYKTYGDESLAVLQNNPYQLEQDIYGVGFKTADRIARSLGLAEDHPSRIEAGVIYALNDRVNDGHVFVPKGELAEQAVSLLGVNPDQILPALARLSGQDRIEEAQMPLPDGDPVGDANPALAEPRGDYAEPVVYLKPFYYGEKGVAARLRHLQEAGPRGHQAPLFIKDPHLTPEQQAAVETALSSPVSVLTGGPGTGKTTCLKALIQHLEDRRVPFALASPTGRAAKRLSEATGHPASTIHRLLEFAPAKGFRYHEKYPLKIDFLIVDEASMLDLLLAHHLLKAIRPGTQVLLVGDVDQLPSVGAGDVLRDVIRSGTVPVTRLHTIFRQAADSQIITNAHRINQGRYPRFSQSEGGDFFLFPAEDAEKAAEWIVDLVAARIPGKFGFDPVTDIQVLSPLYRGAAGVDALNDRLQARLNPPAPRKPDQRLFGTTFRVGDKVMQTQNNYDKDVYNGDIGFIQAINRIDHQLRVVFDGRKTVTYEFTEADELVLAYAVTVHKAQGSEFPVVVMPMITQHYVMLQRNLLYTGITRAQSLCVLAGSPRALHIAISNNQVAHRYSGLTWRLREGEG
jgi:exodeoxyribonuclease V alpha subunit